MNILPIKNASSNPSFQLRFKLSETIKRQLEQNSGKTIEELKAQKFHIKEESIIPYKKGDVLIPRNVYLQTGRVTPSSEVRNTIDNFGATPISRFRKWWSRLIGNK